MPIYFFNKPLPSYICAKHLSDCGMFPNIWSWQGTGGHEESGNNRDLEEHSLGSVGNAVGLP